VQQLPQLTGTWRASDGPGHEDFAGHVAVDTPGPVRGWSHGLTAESVNGSHAA
jgi:hypothetical protein